MDVIRLLYVAGTAVGQTVLSGVYVNRNNDISVRKPVFLNLIRGGTLQFLPNRIGSWVRGSVIPQSFVEVLQELAGALHGTGSTVQGPQCRVQAHE